jgi:hypothetical protein
MTCQLTPSADIPDVPGAWAAYCGGYQAGDSDAWQGLPGDWADQPLSAVRDRHAASRATGYADGYARESRRQQAGGER